MSKISDFILDNISNFSKELNNGQYDFYNFVLKNLKEENNNNKFVTELENRLKEKFKQYDKDTFYEKFEELFQDQDIKLRKLNQQIIVSRYYKLFKDKKKEDEEQKKQEEPKQVNKKYKMKNQQLNVHKNSFEHFQKTVNGVVQDNFRLYTHKNFEKQYKAIIAYNLQDLKDELTKIQQKNNLPFKYHLVLFVETYQMNNGQKQYSSYMIKTDFVTLNNIQNLGQSLLSLEDNINSQIDNLGRSGVNLERFSYVYFNSFQYEQQAVGSYIQIEGLLKNKKACLNIKNTDDMCALYCFMLFYYKYELKKQFLKYHDPKKYDFEYKNEYLHIKSINKEDIDKKIKIGNIQFPCNLSDITKIAKGFGYTFSLFEYQSVMIEKNNKKEERIRLRVVENQKPIEQKQKVQEFNEDNDYYEELDIDDLMNMDQTQTETQEEEKQEEEFFNRHIDLLMNQQENDDKINTHLMIINDFNRLVSNQLDTHNKTYTCKNCLNYFYSEQKLKNHLPNCYEKEKPSQDQYPKKDEQVYFKSFQKQMTLPFFLVCDFESILTKTSEELKLNNKMDEDASFEYEIKTKKIAHHKVVSFGVQVYDQYNLLDNHYYEYIQKEENENVVKKYLELIDTLSQLIINFIRQTNIPYTDSQELQQQKADATKCFLCNLSFKEEKDKVIDHNHFTGEVRGIAHNNCNLHYHLQKTKIPVIFHNLKGYDGHFIVKQIGDYMKENNLDSKIDVIANNSEKFMSITWKNVRFIDSAQFMNSSLEKLGKNLSTNQKTYTMNYLMKEFGTKLNQQELEQIINKGIFPYSWFDTLLKLKNKQLPEKEDFFNDLTNEQIDEEKYNQAVELFNKLGFKSFKQWLQLYQTIDIKLLTDVWINFRNICQDTYGLEPGHYFTSPGLAWDAMLKITKIRLDLITDPDMYLIFEKQSRGGISTTGNLRYAQANNKYCENYDESKSYTQLMYFDANNLYGQAMSQKLPYRNFTFIKEDKFKDYRQDFILKYNNTKFGYVYEVDLEYPVELHDQHNAYPLAPEQVIIQFDQLSKYNRDMVNQLKVTNDIKYISGKQKKLTPNLMDKVRYVCNIRNLKLYLEQGLKLLQIHRIVKYEQSNFMEDYINLNTQKRQQATNEFEKDFFKLMNNSVFGKTMENVRNRASYELVFSKKRMEKIIKSRYFKNLITITENLALVERYKKTVKLDKPAYVGMQILDFSKIVMYNYYYNHLLKEFPKVDLIMTDTDSLFVQVHCSEKYDMYDSMIKNYQFYDFSNVEEGDLYEKIKQHCIKNKLDFKKFINKNKAVVGLMKNEVPNSNISEAISIKAKCYDFITSNNDNKKKLKGIKQYVVKQNINHIDYKDCVTTGKIKYVEQNSLRSFNHEMFTITQEKIALTAINDKRYILEDGINTLAYGNYKITNN